MIRRLQASKIALKSSNALEVKIVTVIQLPQHLETAQNISGFPRCVLLNLTSSCQEWNWNHQNGCHALLSVYNTVLKQLESTTSHQVATPLQHDTSVATSLIAFVHPIYPFSLSDIESVVSCQQRDTRLDAINNGGVILSDESHLCIFHDMNLRTRSDVSFAFQYMSQL